MRKKRTGSNLFVKNQASRSVHFFSIASYRYIKCTYTRLDISTALTIIKYKNCSRVFVFYLFIARYRHAFRHPVGISYKFNTITTI